ncbi:MAG: GNAT family N-acetyltransferase [Methanobacteriota archaeon]|nr:MAG: GNAT family N-acetyltransferase [Euryarchaeota archaeon]
MSAEAYADFLARMGHAVRKVGGVYWFNAHPHVYMSFPFQKLVDPFSVDWSDVSQEDGWCARFPCSIEIGRPSYRIIVDNPEYGLKCLTSKARNQTRRGLENCEVRPVDFRELAEMGMSLNLETMERQGRKASRDFQVYWRRYYYEASRTSGAHAWGAFVNGDLAAYLIGFIMDRVSHILIVRSSRMYLKKYPNNALISEYIRNMMHQGLVDEVSIGLESIQDEMQSLDHFKLGMGFRKEPVGQRIVLRPWLSGIMKPPILGITRALLNRFPRNEQISKIAGLLRWYEEQPSLRR